MNITPAILPHSFEEVIEKCARVEGVAPKIQIDICDGIFGREKTWIPEGVEVLPPGFSYEFDVMLDDWRLPTLHALTLGATSIVAHVDMFNDGDMEALVAMIAPHEAMLGIAVSNDKSIDFHADMIRKARALYPNVYIQVMGIRHIGEQGQEFDPETPARIVALKQSFGDVLLQVDGAMVPETAKLVIDAGAETIVVGSYIFGGEDAGGAMERLMGVENKI